jgi:hypothetical protein
MGVQLFYQSRISEGDAARRTAEQLIAANEAEIGAGPQRRGCGR